MFLVAAAAAAFEVRGEAPDGETAAKAAPPGRDARARAGADPAGTF